MLTQIKLAIISPIPLLHCTIPRQPHQTAPHSLLHLPHISHQIPLSLILRLFQLPLARQTPDDK